ncbi:MAG: lipid 3-O-deacylase family protein, partial [Micavibrio sp.]|nr:lipid 3-O-deacylase family protein [Micavibrio sp.]
LRLSLAVRPFVMFIILEGFTAGKIARFIAFSALLGTIMSITPAQADNIDRVSLSAGAYDLFDKDNQATDFRIEYRPGQSIFWQFKPWIGGEVTTDGTIYGAAGFLYDFSLGNNWILTPSIGAGLYTDGDGKDLGGSIQFREQIEIGYQFQNASRLTGSVSHISNWGIDDKNPGTDVFGVYYHVPMQWIKDGPGTN